MLVEATVSVPPTENPAVPAAVVVPVAAEAVVVKAIVAAPFTTLPPVVAIENERLASPATVNASAELVEPGTKPTSPVTEPTPADETMTVPPVPVVNLPNASTAAGVCVSTIGDTTVAVAEPVAVEVLPEAANAEPEVAANKIAAVSESFFIVSPKAGSQDPCQVPETY